MSGEKMREALMDNGRSYIWGHEAGKESWKCRMGNLFKVVCLNGEKTLLYGCEIWGILSSSIWRKLRLEWTEGAIGYLNYSIGLGCVVI